MSDATQVSGNLVEVLSTSTVRATPTPTLAQRITPEALCQERTAALLQHQQLLAQRDQLFETVQAYREANRSARAQLAQVTAERDALRAALSRHGRHDNDCPLRHEANLPGDSRCTCGFSTALTGGGK